MCVYTYMYIIVHACGNVIYDTRRIEANIFEQLSRDFMEFNDRATRRIVFDSFSLEIQRSEKNVPGTFMILSFERDTR